MELKFVDEVTNSVPVNIYMKAKWKDQRLVSSNGKTAYDLEDVWNPSLQFINRQKLFTSFPDVVHVNQEGTVTCPL